MNNYLSTLEYAISDIGYWSWWDEKFPKTFQIEFGGTLLWNPPKEEGLPPSGQIALVFFDPKSVSFLVHNEAHATLTPDWPDLLHNDQMEPFTVNHDEFCFNDIEKTSEILKKANKINTVFGINPQDRRFYQLKYRLVFWAGEVGLAVGADEMKVFNHMEELSLEQIEALHKKWWDYWKQYWKLRDTENSLPKDYACEVTIPIKAN